jgi:hypothetical protein
MPHIVKFEIDELRCLAGSPKAFRIIECPSSWAREHSLFPAAPVGELLKQPKRFPMDPYGARLGIKVSNTASRFFQLANAIEWGCEKPNAILCARQ